MKIFTLIVSEPCHENWNAMTPDEKGRFCASCQKMVVDFTAMSDRQIAEYFRKTSGSRCGRFHSDQLNREIVVPRKPVPWMKYCFTVTWPALVLLLKSCGQKNEVMGETFFKPETAQLITGRQQKTASAAVMGDTTLVEPVAVEKTTCSMVKGDVEVAPASGEKRKLTPPILNVFTAEKSAIELPCIETKTAGSAAVPDLLNERGTYILGGISIVKSKRFKRQPEMTAPVPMKKKEKCEVTVFPNPVNRNQSIKIKTDKPFNGTYRLINLSGQVMAAGRMIVESKQPFSIPVQSWAAGTYFLKIMNETTGESSSQRIIVQ